MTVKELIELNDQRIVFDILNTDGEQLGLSCFKNRIATEFGDKKIKHWRLVSAHIEVVVDE